MYKHGGLRQMCQRASAVDSRVSTELLVFGVFVGAAVKRPDHRQS